MATWHHADRGGFTLVEVLVALAIISIALLAALRVAGLGANQVGELRARLFAGWVAQNRLAEHHARTDWLPVGRQSGSEHQGNLDFVWREEIAGTPNPAFRRVDVSVFAAPDGSHMLAHVTGFLVDPAGSKR